MFIFFGGYGDCKFHFPFMGGLLYMYAAQIGVDAKGDDLYPILAFQKCRLSLEWFSLLDYFCAISFCRWCNYNNLLLLLY